MHTNEIIPKNVFNKNICWVVNLEDNYGYVEPAIVENAYVTDGIIAI